MNHDDQMIRFVDRCMKLLEHAKTVYDAATSDGERAQINAYAEGIASALGALVDVLHESEAA